MKSKPSIKNVTCRLYPTKEQEELLNKYCVSTRFLYNYLLGLVKKGKIKPNRNALCRILTSIKRRGSVQINGEKK